MIYVVHNHTILGVYEEGIAVEELQEKHKDWSAIFMGEPNHKEAFVKCAWTGDEHGHGTDTHLSCVRCNSCGCDNCGDRRGQNHLQSSGGTYRAEASQSHSADSSERSSGSPLARLRTASRRIPGTTRT